MHWTGIEAKPKTYPWYGPFEAARLLLLFFLIPFQLFYMTLEQLSGQAMALAPCQTALLCLLYYTLFWPNIFLNFQFIPFSTISYFTCLFSIHI